MNAPAALGISADLSPEHLRQEVTVTLPLGAVLRLASHPGELVAGESMVVSLAHASLLPAIGTRWEGGTYAGLSIEDNRPVALILLDGDESMNWDAGVEWAKKRGGVLPSRIDQLVLFKSLKGEFQEAWYWSGEQRAGNPGYAWCQYFGYGSQGYDHEDYGYRVRAVRRFPIQ